MSKTTQPATGADRELRKLFTALQVNAHIVGFVKQMAIDHAVLRCGGAGGVGWSVSLMIQVYEGKPSLHGNVSRHHLTPVVSSMEVSCFGARRP